MRNPLNLPFIILLAFTGLLGGCASEGPTRDMKPEDGAVSAASYLEAPKPSPSLSQLLATLKIQGYDGVGLEFEGDTTLEFLNRVFQSPRAANRRIKLTYTGLALSYDPKHESLTVGGTSDLEAVLKYIEKHIPMRLPPSGPATAPAPK